MIHFKKITKAQAKEWVDSIDALSDAAFDDQVSKWRKFSVDEFDTSYQELRDNVVNCFKEFEESNSYILDLKVGLCIYSELLKDAGFNNVLANDDDIWRYISCKVFPDITYIRYPNPAQNDIRLNRKRFYSHTRRIWLKTLWWYIHLSWQGSSDETYRVLKDCTVDNINKLYEQPGKGFRLNLSRRLMKYYSLISDKSSKEFERIQKRNLVDCKTVEPALTENGVDGYLDNLFMQLDLKRESDAG